MSEQPGMFSCKRCNRDFEWKATLVGKRAKCKCGASFEVPAAAGMAARPITEPIADSPVETPSLSEPSVTTPTTSAPTANTSAPTNKKPDDAGIPALGPAPIEDDGIPALGPEPTDDGVPLFSPMTDSDEVTRDAHRVTASRKASHAGSSNASQSRTPTGPSKSPASSKAQDDDDWDPFADRGETAVLLPDGDAYELDTSTALLPKAPSANAILQTTTMKRAKKKKKDSFLKRGGGEAFLGIPPRLGFAFGAVGISLVLGGLIYILGVGILLYTGVFDEGFTPKFLGTLNTVILLIGIGPLLCLLAPTNWEARIIAIIASGIIGFIMFSLDLDSSQLAVGVIFVCIFWPIVFFGFLERFGESLDIGSLAYAARMMAGCIYAMLIYGRVVRLVLGVHGSPALLKVVSIIPIGITCYLIYIAFKVIVGMLGGAIKR